MKKAPFLKYPSLCDADGVYFLDLDFIRYIMGSLTLFLLVAQNR